MTKPEDLESIGFAEKRCDHPNAEYRTDGVAGLRCPDCGSVSSPSGAPIFPANTDSGGNQEWWGFAEKPAEVVCKCRTFRLDDRGAYLDGDNFVHTLISCPTRRLNDEIAELERAVISAAEKLAQTSDHVNHRDEWETNEDLLLDATCALLKARGTK